jgi:hypothetical protein
MRHTRVRKETGYEVLEMKIQLTDTCKEEGQKTIEVNKPLSDVRK